MSEPLQHSPYQVGGPCRRCGLSYTCATSYVPCFEPDDSFTTWFLRQNEAVRALVPFGLVQQTFTLTPKVPDSNG